MGLDCAKSKTNSAGKGIRSSRNPPRMERPKFVATFRLRRSRILKEMSYATVSIVMPVYNAERYVAQAVESILTQTFGDFEFLIVDDGSTDDSLRILRDYERRDNRVRLISRPNTGYVIALNEMLAMAKGEFVARMDADDISLPERIGRQVAFLREHTDVACVGTSSDRIDAKGRRIGQVRHQLNDDEVFAGLLRGDNPVLHPSVMMRADAAKGAGGYDTSLMPAEDLDLWLRLSEVGRVSVLPDILIKYRLHSGSVSEKMQLVQMQKLREACERAWRRRGVAATFTAEPWRAHDRESRFEFTRSYGWRAWRLGESSTAFAYGLELIRRRPYCGDGWRLCVISMIRRSPDAEL
jgi:glycosyltransferase involved in cell wall biosynthesis